MGMNSKIEWTHHTFNPWRGCTQVSPGCANCYAERQSRRNPGVMGVWGDDGTRVVASEAMWRQPLAWDRAAAAAGDRHRVFCASVADVFEDRPELSEPRGRLLELIRHTPNLDWLLLTKRPENIIRLWDGAAPTGMQYPMPNVWLGTSIENQAAADERIFELLKCPAAVRFLSIEPLLGGINLSHAWYRCFAPQADPPNANGEPNVIHVGRTNGGAAGVEWVIVGGESGPNARPMHPDWVRGIRDQCIAARVPFFFKQWGEWRPVATTREAIDAVHSASDKFDWLDQHGVGGWTLGCEGRAPMVRVGKKAAGRELDGRTWDEVPGSKALEPTA